LDYCNSLLFGTSQRNLDKLQRIHNLFARTVVIATWSVNAVEITRSLHWLYQTANSLQNGSTCLQSYIFYAPIIFVWPSLGH